MASSHSPSNTRQRQTEHIDFHVAKTHSQPLLGIEACLLFDLIQLNDENICSVQSGNAAHVSPVTFTDTLHEFADVFQGYGKLEGTVALKVDKSVQPVRMPLRKLPVPIRDRVNLELQRLVANNIIAPVTEPTSWISALLIVTKPNNDIRVCIDPKPLNRALMRDHYCMPTIDDVLPRLSKAKAFSTADAANAFWHLCPDEESSKLTTFETPFGKFR